MNRAPFPLTVCLNCLFADETLCLNLCTSHGTAFLCVPFANSRLSSSSPPPPKKKTRWIEKYRVRADRMRRPNSMEEISTPFVSACVFELHRFYDDRHSLVNHVQCHLTCCLKYGTRACTMYVPDALHVKVISIWSPARILCISCD